MRNRHIPSPRRWLSLLCLAALLCLLSSCGKREPTNRIHDMGDMLSPAEEEALLERMEALSSESGVSLHLATYKAAGRYDDYIGADYCYEKYDLGRENAALLIVTYDESDGRYYYDMYTYRHMNTELSQADVNAILNHSAVYSALKGGEIATGAEAFFACTIDMCEGRIGVSWFVIIAVSVAAAVLIAFGVCMGIERSYKRRDPATNYPLDRFAKLELTAESDALVSKVVTHTVIPRNRGGGGGGRSAHGGGGGHRGGR